MKLLRPDRLFEIAAPPRENLLRRIVKTQERDAFKGIAFRADGVRIDYGQALECRPRRLSRGSLGEPVNLSEIAALVRPNEQAESLDQAIVGRAPRNRSPDIFGEARWL